MASRQYGVILGLIDRLPRHSQTRAAMEDDEEYVALVREAYLNDDGKKKKKDEDAKGGPSPAEWPYMQSDLMADMIEEIRYLRAVVSSALGSKDTPKPYARPKTLLMEMSSSIRLTKRRMKHEALVNRLVPKKRE